MKERTVNVIFGICIILSVLFIALGCLAPILFSQCSSGIDFTETGQIGDTIGGTMSPFVAIAGVLMTFMAFLMQVRANEIQREQLKKSFNLKTLENKIESRNALELLNIDIKAMLASVSAICKEIDEFCAATQKRPTGDVAFRFTPKYTYERYRTIDRNLLFSAFKSFMADSNAEQTFVSVYNKIDFYAEGIQMLKDNVYQPSMDDIMRVKLSIPDAYDKMICAINKKSHSISQQLLMNFKNEVLVIAGGTGVLDVLRLWHLVNEKKYNHIYTLIPDEYALIMSKINALITQNNQLVENLQEVSTTFRDKNIYDWLKETSKQIEQALCTHSVESIQDKYRDRL